MLKSFNNRLSLMIKKFPRKLFAMVLAGLFILYLLLSYFAINPLAKKLIPSIAKSSLDSEASVGHVEFDPFRLKATINDFKLKEKSGAPLAGFKKLVIDLEFSGVFDLAWKFKQISLLAPQVNVAVDGDGKLNWDDLVAKLNQDKAPPSDTIPRLMIEHFMVSQGGVDYTDVNRTEPLNVTLTPIGFQLKGFSTLPKDRGEYFISAEFAEDGGILKWKGDMGVNPVASKGVVALEGVKIASLLQLAKGLALPVEINHGDFRTSFNYDFSAPQTIPTLVLKDLKLGLSDIAAELPQGGTLSLTYAGLGAEKLNFVSNKQPTLQVKALDFKLLGLSVQQDNGTQIGLEESAAKLPQLDFLMANAPQLMFDHLNATLTNIHVNQSEQLSLALPSISVNEVGLNLAENNVRVKAVVLSKINLSQKSAGLADNPVNNKPLATLDQVTLTDGSIALSTKKVSAQSLLLSGFQTSIIRNANQSLNWVEALKTKPSSVEVNATPVSIETVQEQPASSEASAWQVSLKKIALNDAEIHIQDNSVPTAVVMDIVKANIELEDASLDMTKPLPIKADFKVKQGGQFSAKGEIWPSPGKADLGLRLSGLSLKPFAPYVNQFALLKLDSGAADVSGELTMAQKQDLSLVFKGQFDVKKLALLEEADNAPFLSWDHVISKDLNVSLMPNKLHMATLQVVKPSGKFIIYPDRTINVKRILRSEATKSLNAKPESIEKALPKQPIANNDSLIQAPPVRQLAESKSNSASTQGLVKPSAESTPSTTADIFPVSIDSLRVDDGKLEFADLSLTPQFGTNMHSLNGVINGLSTKVDKVSQVEIDGKVDEYGSAKIRGSLQPFNATAYTDLELIFTNLDMSRLTPYSGKFAGRHIDAGKLSVNLEYKIKQQQLVGENKFVINKLKLGEKVDSSDAADLPLDLAIAILEDSDGIIDLDLPISGSLDDPTFSYGGIIWKAFKNVLTKIVTAPFRALGKLFGGGAEDFDGIAFEAGTSEVAPPELEKLIKVSQALVKRQGLSLGIVPSYHQQLDTAAIKETNYRKQVAEEMGVELKAGQRAGPVDLTNEKTQEAIDSLYDKLTKKGFLKRMVSKFEKPEDGHYEKAQASLIDSIEVTDGDLKQLAEARGKAIEAALLNHGVSADRLSIINVVKVNAATKVVKTELKLDVKKSATKASEQNQETLAPEPIPSSQVVN